MGRLGAIMGKRDAVLEKLVELLTSFGKINKAVLFGSRARGDNDPKSDYDVAVYLEEPDDIWRLRSFFDDADTLCKIDLVSVDGRLPSKLRENIEKEGIVIMERKSKRENYGKAVLSLKKAIEEYQKAPYDTMRDGVIQRFEFTAELAWKACREYLKEIGYAEINGPKPVMREAFSYGIIENEETWLRILTDRNLTSHVYSDDTANEIFSRISTRYIYEFEALSEYFLEKNKESW